MKKTVNASRLCLVIATLLASQVLAGEPLLPSQAPQQHLGAASCAGSTCHGAGSPSQGSSVMQNEFLTWERQDAHAKAYKALQSEAGRRIAANLGLASATGPACTNCHADSVPAALQGKRYRLSEGVSCEACHGGAEKWLGPHITGVSTQATLLAAGLYPLADPAARGRLCLSCHQSSEERPATHKLFGAGHPPLNRFELDTYTATQPAHFRVDADYRKRKVVASSARIWAAGQVQAASAYLDELLSARFAQHGAFPELSLYDCDACHHPMRSPRWNAGLGGDLEPGSVRLADTSLTLVGHLVGAMAPKSDVNWKQQLEALRKAGMASVGGVKDSAGQLKSQLAGLKPLLSEHEPSTTEIQALLGLMVKDAESRTAGSYLHAAQTTMAVAAISNGRPGSSSAAWGKGVDALFKATDSAADYDPAAFRAALKSLATQIRLIQ